VQGRVSEVKEETVRVRLPNDVDLSAINSHWRDVVVNARFDYGKHQEIKDNSSSSGVNGGVNGKVQDPVHAHVRLQPSRNGFDLMKISLFNFLESYLSDETMHYRLLFPDYWTATDRKDESSSSANKPVSGMSMQPPPGLGLVTTDNNKKGAADSSGGASSSPAWTPVNNKLNESQKLAVDKILTHNPIVGPNLIFGPPGTGYMIYSYVFAHIYVYIYCSNMMSCFFARILM
jgi:hypothetical protein